MFGLTSIGTVHTAIGLIAVIAGYAMLLRHGRIGLDLKLGSLYLWTTVITCLTGFGIFQHGGFNIAHALGVVTLFTLALVVAAGRLRLFGRFAPYVETLGFTLTVFFHMIPGITESFTRFPLGSPLFTGPEDPKLEKVVGTLFLLFLVGMALQARQIRKAQPGLRQTRLA